MFSLRSVEGGILVHNTEYTSHEFTLEYFHVDDCFSLEFWFIITDERSD